jgi:hypothetical protein
MQTKSRYSLPRGLTTLGLLAGALVPAHSQVTTTKSIDEPGRHPYQAFVSVAIAQNFLNGFGNLPKVPKGQRLVIDYVSAEINDVVTDLERLQVTLSTTGGGQGGVATLLGTEAIDQNIRSSVSQAIRLYGDPGTTPQVFVLRNSAPQAITVDVTVTGHLITLP